MRIKAEEEASREWHGEPRRETIVGGFSRQSQGLIEKRMRCNVENSSTGFLLPSPRDLKSSSHLALPYDKINVVRGGLKCPNLKAPR